MDGHPSPLRSSSRNNQVWRFSLRLSNRVDGTAGRKRQDAHPIM